MHPTLTPGDHVFVCLGGAFAEGSLVVARHPFKADVVLIKRVASIGDGGVELSSDNPAEGSDSRTLGRVPVSHVLGPVTGWI